MYSVFAFRGEPLRILFCGLCTLGLALIPIGGSSAGSLTQFFPVNASGQPTGQPASGWRIKWRVVSGGDYGAGDAVEFCKIEFMKGRKADGSEDWIRVLNRMALAEMYVPYNNPSFNFFDIGSIGATMLPARQSYLPTGGAFRSRIENEADPDDPDCRDNRPGNSDSVVTNRNVLISELRDDGVRWMDNEINGGVQYRIRRGQVLRLWGTLEAANYSYTIVYDFSDDGRISARVGGTAQNFSNLDPADLAATRNLATHVHMGAWRMEFDLGDSTTNKVEIVEREFEPSTGRGRVNVRPFNNNREGGEEWQQDKFTLLKVTNTTTQNRHDPPSNVSYVVRSRMHGRLRARTVPGGAPTHGTTDNDFWVSQLRSAAGTEVYKFIDMPRSIANSTRQLTGEPLVVWHSAGLQHIPRGEDFGPRNYQAVDGAAINSFTGFDLIPVNLWHKTPFLNREGGQDRNQGTSDFQFTRLLRLRTPFMSGDDVEALQRLLNQAGCEGTPIEVDKKFGHASKRAVEGFQNANRLSVDGRAGAGTIRSLQSGQRC